MLTVGTLVSVDVKLAKQMQKTRPRRWPVGLPHTAQIEILSEVPGPPNLAPNDPMKDFFVKFPNGQVDRLTQMFLCPDSPPFVGCNCNWHPS